MKKEMKDHQDGGLLWGPPQAVKVDEGEVNRMMGQMCHRLRGSDRLPIYTKIAMKDAHHRLIISDATYQALLHASLKSWNTQEVHTTTVRSMIPNVITMLQEHSGEVSKKEDFENCKGKVEVPNTYERMKQMEEDMKTLGIPPVIQTILEWLEDEWLTSQAGKYCIQTNQMNIWPLKGVPLNLSSTSLRWLTKTGVYFMWTKKRQTKVERLKELTADDTLFRYDDITRKKIGKRLEDLKVKKKEDGKKEIKDH